MLNLDMVAYADAMPEDLNLVVNERSQWLSVKYGGASARYAPLAIATTLDASWPRSDHWPFWQNGYDAVEAGYHVYRSVTPHAGYERVTAAPVRDTVFTDRAPAADRTYYYVVTAVDASGQESNFSIERADDGSLNR